MKTTYTKTDIVFLNIQSKDYFFTIQENEDNPCLSKIPKELINEPIDFDSRYEITFGINIFTIKKVDLSRKAKLRNLKKLLEDRTLDSRDKKIIRETNFYTVDENYDFIMAGIFDLENWKRAFDLK